MSTITLEFVAVVTVAVEGMTAIGFELAPQVVGVAAELIAKRLEAGEAVADVEHLTDSVVAFAIETASVGLVIVVATETESALLVAAAAEFAIVVWTEHEQAGPAADVA